MVLLSVYPSVDPCVLQKQLIASGLGFSFFTWTFMHGVIMVRSKIRLERGRIGFWSEQDIHVVLQSML